MTEKEIAEGLKGGAPQAFRELYQAYGSSIYSYLMRVTGRREMAEDLCQETFLMVIRKIGFFRAERDSSLRSWIFRIASHLAIDLFRREKRFDITENVPETATSEAPDQLLSKSQYSEELQVALNSLTASQRMIFLLHEQEEMSCMDISRVCGCSENAVKQSLLRSRNQLKRRLAP